MKYYFIVFTLFISFALLSQQEELQRGPYNYSPETYHRSSGQISDNIKIGNHMLFGDVFQLFFKQLTFGYEYIHDSDNVALRFPVTLGLGKKYMEFGTELKFFITQPYTFYRKIGPWDAGDAYVRYFLGPALCAINVQNDWLGSVRFSNGISMQFVKGLNLSAYGSLGPGMYFTDNNSTNAETKGDIFFYWAINGSVGWRFGGK